MLNTALTGGDFVQLEVVTLMVGVALKLTLNILKSIPTFIKKKGCYK